MKSWSIFLYSLALYGTFIAGSIQLRSNNKRQLHIEIKKSWLTFTVVTLTCIGMILQSFWPQTLDLFMRNTQLFLKGQLWRIVTPLFFQDGGWAGGISNIAGLLFIGTLAEHFWSRKEWVIIYFAGGIFCEIAALWWQPFGAGNSIANLCLAGSIAFICLKNSRSHKIRILSIISLAPCILLLAIRDIHGVALVSGCIIALLITRLKTNRENQSLWRKL